MLILVVCTNNIFTLICLLAAVIPLMLQRDKMRKAVIECASYRDAIRVSVPQQIDLTSLPGIVYVMELPHRPLKLQAWTHTTGQQPWS